jgi:hypothetical protein
MKHATAGSTVVHRHKPAAAVAVFILCMSFYIVSMLCRPISKAACGCLQGLHCSAVDLRKAAVACGYDARVFVTSAYIRCVGVW